VSALQEKICEQDHRICPCFFDIIIIIILIPETHKNNKKQK